MRLTFGILVAAIALSIAFAGIIQRPVWTSDGFTYSMIAQVDAGRTYEQAHATTETAYRQQRPPQWWHLFSIRAIYPWLGSLLWQQFGFRSLFVISALAYGLAATLLYVVLLAVARPWLSALVSLSAMLSHEALLLARSNLTDMLAFAALVWTVLAVLRYVRNGRAIDLLGFTAAACALSLTRPVPYIPLCIGLAFLFSRWRREALPMIGISAALCVAVVAGLRLLHAEDLPFGNYGASVATTSAHALAWFATSFFTPVALAGLLLWRRSATAIAALGVFASTIPTIIVDPLPLDLERVVFFPATIALAFGLAIALECTSRVVRVVPLIPRMKRENAGTLVERAYTTTCYVLESTSAAPRPK